MNLQQIVAELRAERDRLDKAIAALNSVSTHQTRATAQSGSEIGETHASPQVKCNPQEALAAAQAALGARKDEAEGKGEVGQAVARNQSPAVAQGLFFARGRHCDCCTTAYCCWTRTS